MELFYHERINIQKTLAQVHTGDWLMSSILFYACSKKNHAENFAISFPYCDK
jgi:hypothetical protein